MENSYDWKWMNMADFAKIPPITGPMLHGLNMGKVAMWLEDERGKRRGNPSRAKDLADMLAEGELTHLTPEELAAIMILAEHDRQADEVWANFKYRLPIVRNQESKETK